MGLLHHGTRRQERRADGRQVRLDTAIPAGTGFWYLNSSTGETPDKVTKRVNNPHTGEDDGTVLLVAPAKEGGAFFRVNRSN